MIPTLAATLTASALGASTWSVAEFLIHQNLGHRFAKNRNFFAREHVRHHATTIPPRASSLRSKVSRKLDDIIAKALAKERANRFADATELIDALLTV